jgi:hypothetical protein
MLSTRGNAVGSTTRRRRGLTLCVGFLATVLGLALPLSTAAAAGNQQAEFTANDAMPGGQFGVSAAISADGNTALVAACGAPLHPGFCTGTPGAAYVFTRSGSAWSQQQKLTASDGAPNDAFGRDVSLSADGNTALIGAYNKNAFIGAAYVFTRSGSTWSQQQELTASDGVSTDSFGETLSLSGDGTTALIGSQSHGGTGAAYVFTRSGSIWSQQQELTPSDGVSGDAFGRLVSLDGDGNIAAIGARFKNASTGAAYIFTRSGTAWTQQQELTASDGVAGDQFGPPSLSSDGSTALIAAPGKNSFTGAAYVFTRSGSTWSQQQELTASDGVAGDLFSGAFPGTLSADGSSALIGAPGKNSFTGAAYVFTRSACGFNQQEKLTASDGAPGDAFGFDTPLSGDGSTALIGAPGSPFNPAATGKAYVFTTASFPSSGAFVVGDGSAAGHVYFWGSQWAKNNTLSGGAAPNAFKGFASSSSSGCGGAPSSHPSGCGGTWTSSPGNSADPPTSVPAFMTVIVASHVTKSGSSISGDVLHMVVVQTDPGYQSNPGHPGTGTVIQQIC